MPFRPTRCAFPGHFVSSFEITVCDLKTSTIGRTPAEATGNRELAEPQADVTLVDPAPIGNARPIPQTPPSTRGKSQVLKGHGFSRAANG